MSASAAALLETISMLLFADRAERARAAANT
jgi:hypothetical protein